MNAFVNAIIQGNFDKIQTSIKTLEVTIDINNRLKKSINTINTIL